jgi:ubiquinone/menaquinone biosynthesis C-methylase UbiE
VTERLRRRWDKHAAEYDRSLDWADRHFFGDTRPWLCGQATGDVLEVSIGTGLNLPYYPEEARLTGLDWSPEMLAVARQRADDLGRAVELKTGDAQALGFPDGTFDTVVCSFSLCAIPDDRRAVGEMVRVLRPGGLLLLADHVVGSRWWVRTIQWVMDLVSVPLDGEHHRRRPIRHVEALGLTVERHDRFKAGVIERLAARKPR